MASNNASLITFTVAYGEERWTVSLPRNETIRDLRNEIFEKSGILPQQQTLEWDGISCSSNDTILETCSDLNNINFIILRSPYDKMKNSTYGMSNTALDPEYGIEDPEKNHDLDSMGFQQLMLDRLGDRDYDSFDYFEHHLLEDKIAYALYGPPQNENGYDEKQIEAARELFTIILRENNTFAKFVDHVIVSFIYNCTEPLPKEKSKRAKKYADYNPKTDMKPHPIFVLRKCTGVDSPCRIFIDHTGRVYQSWTDYLMKNTLPSCFMILPRYGRYARDKNHAVIVDRYLSPAGKIGAKILQGTDIASALASVGTGGVFLVAAIPAITVAPAALITAAVAGVGIGIYSLGRSIHTLVDRNQHKQTMHIANPEARGAYINIVAGSLGFFGAGANMAVARLATRGVYISKGVTGVVTTLNIANLSAGSSAIINSGYDVIDKWVNEKEPPSLLVIVQFTSSVLFFGHAVYNFKMGTTIVNEAQAESLKNYQESLRSNRHRKTFNKLIKETVRRQNGSITKGRAEVISTIRNIPDKDRVFAALTRSNKQMNKNNVRFSAEGGNIKFNGHFVDMAEFVRMDKNDRLSYFSQLPKLSKECQVAKTSSMMKSWVTDINMGQIAAIALKVVELFENNDSFPIDKIMMVATELVNFLKVEDINCWKFLDELYPNADKYITLARVANEFISKLLKEFVDNQERKYQYWKANGSPPEDKPFFSEMSLDYIKRVQQFIDIGFEIYFTGRHLSLSVLTKLSKYLCTWLVKKVYEIREGSEREEKRNVHSPVPALSKSCSVCMGVYSLRTNTW